MTYKIVGDIDPEIFRGYDIRGIVDEQINEDVYYTFGRAYATWLAKRRIRECPVGRDVRLTSEAYSKALIAGLNDGGIDTYDLGSTLSQIVYFADYELKTKGLVMITASHNPSNYNGLKLGTGYSETMLTDEIIDFRDLVASGDFIEPTQKGTNVEFDAYPAYEKQLVKLFDLKKNWKVVVDGCATGSGVFYPKLLRAAGCEVIEQNCEPDGNFPAGTPDPIDREVLERLGEGVKKAGADIGFAYDTDGDRMAVADNNGNALWMDVIVALFAKSVLKNIPGAPIVFNTLCSQAVRQTILDNGGKPVVWLTGHSFIKAKVAEERAPFGGELSGHIYFTDNYFGHDDAANACLRLLAFLEQENKTLSEAVAELPQYVSSPQVKLGISEKIKFSFIEEKIIPEFKATWPDAEFTDIDGIRFDLPDRMAILRASQNGAYITTKFEGKTQESYDDVREKLSAILRKYPEVEWDSPESSNASALD